MYRKLGLIVPCDVSLIRQAPASIAFQPTTIMLPRLRPKHTHRVPLLPRALSTRVPSTNPGPLGPFGLPAEFNQLRTGTKVRFYSQQPPAGGGFSGFPLQQQRNKGDALKEFVGPPLRFPFDRRWR